MTATQSPRREPRRAPHAGARPPLLLQLPDLCPPSEPPVDDVVEERLDKAILGDVAKPRGPRQVQPPPAAPPPIKRPPVVQPPAEKAEEVAEPVHHPPRQAAGETPGSNWRPTAMQAIVVASLALLFLIAWIVLSGGQDSNPVVENGEPPAEELITPDISIGLPEQLGVGLPSAEEAFPAPPSAEPRESPAPEIPQNEPLDKLPAEPAESSDSPQWPNMTPYPSTDTSSGDSALERPENPAERPAQDLGSWRQDEPAAEPSPAPRNTDEFAPAPRGDAGPRYPQTDPAKYHYPPERGPVRAGRADEPQRPTRSADSGGPRGGSFQP